MSIEKYQILALNP